MKCSRCGYSNPIAGKYVSSGSPLCESCLVNEQKIGIKVERIK